MKQLRREETPSELLPGVLLLFAALYSLKKTFCRTLGVIPTMSR